MYDIFNNALSHGGKINITFDRLFIVPENGTVPHFTESQLQKKSKYGNRNRLEDITLRIALVVSDRISTGNPNILGIFPKMYFCCTTLVIRKKIMH